MLERWKHCPLCSYSSLRQGPCSWQRYGSHPRYVGGHPHKPGSGGKVVTLMIHSFLLISGVCWEEDPLPSMSPHRATNGLDREP